MLTHGSIIANLKGALQFVNQLEEKIIDFYLSFHYLMHMNIQVDFFADSYWCTDLF